MRKMRRNLANLILGLSCTLDEKIDFSEAKSLISNWRGNCYIINYHNRSNPKIRSSNYTIVEFLNKSTPNNDRHFQKINRLLYEGKQKKRQYIDILYYDIKSKYNGSKKNVLDRKLTVLLTN